jgi:hypothetical protein
VHTASTAAIGHYKARGTVGTTVRHCGAVMGTIYGLCVEQWLENRRPLEPMEMLQCGALTNHKHDFVGVRRCYQTTLQQTIGIDRPASHHKQT